MPEDKQGLEQVEDRDRGVGAGWGGWVGLVIAHPDWEMVPVEFFKNSDRNSSAVDATDDIIVLPTINFSSLHGIISISSIRRFYKG